MSHGDKDGDLQLTGPLLMWLPLTKEALTPRRQPEAELRAQVAS